MRRFSILLSLLGVLFISSSFAPKAKPFGVKVIVIDAGHGGKDPGCHGKKHLEKDVALAVALKLGEYIQENLKDVKVVYTRTTDVFVELQERAAIANREKADLFISIHCNSACVRDKKLKKDICRETTAGAETYVMGIKNEQGNLNIAKRENSAILLEDDYVKKYEGFDPNSDESYIIMSMFADTHLDHSLSFASKIQKQYCQKIGRTDRGVKRASLWVLWRTYMPSVLTEIGYLTNPNEELFLGSETGQSYIASGLFRAFREYKDEIEGVSKKYDDVFEKQQPYKITDKDSEETKPNKTNTVSTIDTTVEKKRDIVPEKNINEGFSGNKEVIQNKQEVIGNKDTQVVVAEKAKDIPPKEKISDPNKIKIPLQKDSVKVEQEKNKNNSTVIYKVQIYSSDVKLSHDNPKFNGLSNIGVYEVNGVFKYTSGEFYKKEEAFKHRIVLKSKGFSDAFVIATKDGNRIPLK